MTTLLSSALHYGAVNYCHIVSAVAAAICSHLSARYMRAPADVHSPYISTVRCMSVQSTDRRTDRLNARPTIPTIPMTTVGLSGWAIGTLSRFTCCLLNISKRMFIVFSSSSRAVRLFVESRRCWISSWSTYNTNKHTHTHTSIERAVGGGGGRASFLRSRLSPATQLYNMVLCFAPCLSFDIQYTHCSLFLECGAQ